MDVRDDGLKPKKNRRQTDKQTTCHPLSAPAVAEALEKTQISKYRTNDNGGHGFAAEDANNFADQIRGKRAEITGTSNELNGPDRIVDGLHVQSKYFRSAYETVDAAFDASTGNYRYLGQTLEVPRDQYETCVSQMRDRIMRGKVPGVTDPEAAVDLVKQGTVTYKQARNIARAGNVDSLIFDSKTQGVTATGVFAVSFVITYAQGCRCGISSEEAIKAALQSALASGSTTFITGVVSAQFLRTRAAAIGVESIRSGVWAVSSTTVGRTAIHRIAAGSLGKSVYGAAAINHVSKLLRSNAVTATVVTVVSSAPDFYRAAFDGSISWQQFVKNTIVNATGVVGGVGGWMAGAAVGASVGSVVPFVGTFAGGFIGGLVGGLVGGTGAHTVAKSVSDSVVDDDSKSLVKAMEDEIQSLASEYMLTEDEVEQIASKVGKTVDQKWLQRMYKETKGPDRNSARCKFVRTEFEPEFEAIIRRRPKITPPSVKQFEAEVSNLVEELDLDDVDQGRS